MFPMRQLAVLRLQCPRMVNKIEPPHFPLKCHSIAADWVSPLNLSFDLGTPSDCLQTLGFLSKVLSHPSSVVKQLTRHRLVAKRWSVAELSTTALLPLLNTLVLPHVESIVQVSSIDLVADANP